MLGNSESFLVHTIRSIVIGHGRCQATLCILHDFVGVAAPDLVRTLAILLGAIDNGCRRPVTIGYRGDSRLTPDEVQIVAIIAAAQRDEGAELAARLNWLVGGPHHKPVAIAARIVGRLLQVNGVALLPPPREQLPAMASVA